MRTGIGLVVLLAFLGIGFAQDAKSIKKSKPDMSGIWSSGLITLKITFKDPKLKITRITRVEPPMVFGSLSNSREFIYFTDGRDETRIHAFGPYESFQSKSKTNWDGDKLVVRTSYSKKASGKLLTVDTTDTWEISPDGTTLARTIRAESSNSQQTSHEIFNRYQKQ